ncbi:hypothetical protein C8R48DRAFT_782314 [Suillus tomentosus]|nr:hypothetical protein C8R48DRAFT_782314 [Suillus tomentosus]
MYPSLSSSSPTNDDIHHDLPNHDVRVEASSNLIDEYHDPHTLRTMGASESPSQLWHDATLGHMPQPYQPALEFGQQLRPTVDNESFSEFYNNSNDQSFPNHHNPYYYRRDSLHDAADGPSTSTSIGIPPQPLPYDTHTMSLEPQSYPQPKRQSHVMVPTFNSDGVVHHHFQPDSELRSMHPQMQNHHAATFYSAAPGPPAFSPSDLVREPSLDESVR